MRFRSSAADMGAHQAPVLSAHVKAQAARFARLFAVAAVPPMWQLVQTGHVTWPLAWAVVVGAAEVAYRQWRKTS